jgi:hypothetical protein
MNCGNNGYLMAFGNRYCLDYLEGESHFSWQGQKWLDSVRDCLQVELEEPTQNYSCGTIDSYALQTHYDCYSRTGYCQLPLTDKIAVGSTAKGLLTDPQVVELLDRIETHCLQERLEQI